MYPRSPRAARAFWLLPLPRGLKDLLEKLSLQCLGLWGARGEEQWLALPQFPLLGGAPVLAGLWMWISPAPSKGSWAGGSALVFGSVWPQLRSNKRGHHALINPSPGMFCGDRAVLMIQLLSLHQNHLSQVLWLLIGSGSPLLAAASTFLEHRGINESLRSSSHPPGLAWWEVWPFPCSCLWMIPECPLLGTGVLLQPRPCASFLPGKTKSRIKQ